jgi:hypothetical protein
MILIQGRVFLWVRGKGKVVRMLFEAQSDPEEINEQTALYLFQEGATDLKEIENTVIQAINGKREFKDKIERIATRAGSSIYGDNTSRVRAEDLLPTTDVDTKISFVSPTKAEAKADGREFEVQVMPTLDKKIDRKGAPELFKVKFSGKVPAELSKRGLLIGKAKRIETEGANGVNVENKEKEYDNMELKTAVP